MMRAVKEAFPLPKGVLELVFLDGQGNRIGYVKSPNMVVAAGRGMMAAAMGSVINRVAVGTNGASPTPDDVAPLAEQFAVVPTGITYPDARSVQVAFTVAADQYNGHVIREFGLERLAGETYTLFARKAFPDGFAKTADVVIQGTWTVTF
ncbi:MAG: hypothetical protein FJ087_01515 [Deltaproteobacteria bacterium]|nr:hypothetical protein [Deltaproteobacteria bacterium]